MNNTNDIEEIYDFDTEDETKKCPKCGSRMKRGYETYEFLGFPFREEIYYCPKCD